MLLLNRSKKRQAYYNHLDIADKLLGLISELDKTCEERVWLAMKDQKSDEEISKIKAAFDKEIYLLHRAIETLHNFLNKAFKNPSGDFHQFNQDVEIFFEVAFLMFYHESNAEVRNVLQKIRYESRIITFLVSFPAFIGGSVEEYIDASRRSLKEARANLPMTHYNSKLTIIRYLEKEMGLELPSSIQMKDERDLCLMLLGKVSNVFDIASELERESLLKTVSDGISGNGKMMRLEQGSLELICSADGGIIEGSYSGKESNEEAAKVWKLVENGEVLTSPKNL